MLFKNHFHVVLGCSNLGSISNLQMIDNLWSALKEKVVPKLVDYELMIEVFYI